jgi:hypothetical protein
MSDQTNMPLPPKWSRTTIGVVIEDKVPQNGPSGDDTFTYVDIGGIENSTKRIVDPKLLSVGEAPSRAKQVLAADDVLVSMTRPNLNAVAKVPAELDGAIGSTGFHVLRTKIIEPSWLYYTVQSNDFVHAMCQVVQGALYPAVRPRDIRSYGLPIPPLNEQRRIVDKIEELFSDLDAGVAALTRAKANLKRYRASVLKAAVEGHLTAAWRAEHPGTEDNELELEFRRVCDGMNYTAKKFNFEIVFPGKQINSTGLQLADLTARPIGRFVMNPDQANRAYAIIEKKLDRAPSGSVDGYGLKIYP